MQPQKLTAVTGDAEAIAGSLSEAIGFESDFIGDVNIAGSATGELGILSYATSDLTTEAQTTSGDASASSEDVVVKGAENMNLDVGGNVEGEWGARALALGTFNASAESVNGEITDAKISADARGFDASLFGAEQFIDAAEEAPGFSDIDIKEAAMSLRSLRWSPTPKPSPLVIAKATLFLLMSILMPSAVISTGHSATSPSTATATSMVTASTAVLPPLLVYRRRKCSRKRQFRRLPA